MAPPSARPRDKGGTVSAAKEYANSNSTSARFLGGPQKSWMNMQTQNSNALRPNAPLMRKDGHQQQQPVTLRERPGYQQNSYPVVPQESGSRFAPLQSPSASQSPPNRVSPSLGNLDSSILQKDPTSTLANVEGVLPSPAPSDEHRPDGFRHLEHENENQRPGGHASVHEPAFRRVEDDGWDNHVSSPVLITTRPAAGFIPPTLSNSTTIQACTSLNQPVTQGVLRGKRKRVADGPNAAFGSAISSRSESAAEEDSDSWMQHRNGHRPSEEQMRIFLSAVVSRQQRLVHQGGAAAPTESARLNLLQQACAQQDHQYLLLHQIYCGHPRSPSMTQQLLIMGFSPEHFRGLEMLASLLLPNSTIDLTAEAVDWFSVFPFPFQKLLHDFQLYHEVFDHVKSSLMKLAQSWARFQANCIERHYPPFADELVSAIGVESPILQSVMFRAINKSIWRGGLNDTCYGEVERLFYENQHRAHQRPISPIGAGRQAENQNLIFHYQRIQTAHLNHSQVTASNNQVPASLAHNAPMPPPSTHAQGRSQDNHRAIQSYNLSRGPVLSNLNTQLAQNTFPRHPNGPPPIVPSQLFLQEQQNPLNLQNLARASSISSDAASTPTGPQAPHGRTPSSGGPLRALLPSDHAWYPPQRPSSDQGLQSSQWSAPPTYASQVHQGQFVQSTSNSFGVHTASPTMMSPPGQGRSEPMVPHPRSRQNALARPIYQQSLLPPSGQVIPGTAQPNPAQTAIHQYNAKSPVLTAMDRSDLRTGSVKYYRCLQEVSTLPDRLQLGSRHYIEWSFDVDEASLRSLSGTSIPQTGFSPVRPVQVGSMFRQVRCIDATKFVGAIEESEWAVARHIWPSHVTVLLNGSPLDVRKKIHYGRDLPVDVTAHIQRGSNKLSISIIRGPKDDKRKYAIGVESIRLLDSDSAKALTSCLPYNEARQRILRRLQNKEAEVEVMDPSITLNLRDPFVSSIWDVPMRSRTCLHDQCFDLDNYLQTRSSRRAGQPCDPDQFKCPICDADARPQSLIKDSFFVGLRETLVKMNRLDAKEIIMQQDGTWQIKEEERTGETGDGMGRPSNGGEKAVTRRVSSRGASEMIEIDDD